jgi:ferredoxin-2, mitochondrial
MELLNKTQISKSTEKRMNKSNFVTDIQKLSGVKRSLRMWWTWQDCMKLLAFLDLSERSRGSTHSRRVNENQFTNANLRRKIAIQRKMSAAVARILRCQSPRALFAFGSRCKNNNLRFVGFCNSRPFVHLGFSCQLQQQTERFVGHRSLSGGHEHAHSHGHDDAPKVPITFVYEKTGKKQTVQGSVGMNLLRVAHANEIELEGACECSLACSTCHLVLEDNVFQSLPEPSDKENDMLDLAFGLTPSSRLGCQVILTEDMADAVFIIPAATRNMYVDGHVPKPH